MKITGAVIGLGNMGKHHLRVCTELGYNMYECDIDIKNKNILNKDKFTTDHRLLLEDKLDFAIIATPTKTHLNIAKHFLQLNIPVLIEKPIFDSTEYKDLEPYKDKIMVGHIEQFNPVMIKIKRLLMHEKVITCNFKRVGLYPVQIDDDIITDFAIHDINNSLFLFGKPDSCYGVGNKNDDSLCTLKYSDFNVLLQTSWNVPYKLRQIEIICENGIIVGDLINLELTFETKNSNISYKIEYKEPLEAEILHFIKCIKSKRPFQTNYDNAIETLLLAEKIKTSNKKALVISV